MPTKAEIEELIHETKAAIKTLTFLYPDAGGKNRPKSAGVVLRRFQLRERDLLGFLEIAEDCPMTKFKVGNLVRVKPKKTVPVEHHSAIGYIVDIRPRAQRPYLVLIDVIHRFFAEDELEKV